MELHGTIAGVFLGWQRDPGGEDMVRSHPEIFTLEILKRSEEKTGPEEQEARYGHLSRSKPKPHRVSSGSAGPARAGVHQGLLHVYARSHESRQEPETQGRQSHRREHE